MINTNVNNFCITPVAGANNVNTTKNVTTNNYNIYPGNSVPDTTKNSNLFHQRRGSDSTIVQ